MTVDFDDGISALSTDSSSKVISRNIAEKFSEKLEAPSLDKYHYSIFTLRFFNSAMEKRFWRYLTLQQSFHGSILSIFCPSFLFTCFIIGSYVLFYEGVFPILAFLGGLCLVLLYNVLTAKYCYLIKIQSSSMKKSIQLEALNITMHGDMVDDVCHDHIERGSVEVKQLIENVDAISSHIIWYATIVCYLSAIIFVFFTAIRKCCTPCNNFCIYQVPIPCLMILHYIPLHYLVCSPIPCIHVIICDIILKIAIVSLIYQDIHRRHERIYGNMITIGGIWIYMSFVLWHFFRKSVITFIQRDILADIAVAEERRNENNQLFV